MGTGTGEVVVSSLVSHCSSSCPAAPQIHFPLSLLTENRWGATGVQKVNAVLGTGVGATWAGTCKRVSDCPVSQIH